MPRGDPVCYGRLVNVRLRSRLAAVTLLSALVAGWVVWAATPPVGDAVGGSVKVVALWLSTGIVIVGLLFGGTPLERGALASLRLPLLAAVTAPLSLLPVMASGSAPLVAFSFALWPFANLLLADVLAGTAATARVGFLLRVASVLLTLASVALGLAMAAVGWPDALPVSIVLILLAGSIATVPGVAGGFAFRRVDADRLGATSTDLVTGIALAAFGITPMVASLVLRAPWESLGLAVLVAWLASLAVAARFAVSPLARLADRSSAQRDLVVAVAESERARLAGQLHDGPLQNLLLLTRRLELAGDPAAAAAVRSVADELREVCGELRVPILDDLGAGPALEWLVARLCRLTGDQIVLERLDRARPPAGVELAVFRIAQEALANAVRHAGAATVDVRLSDHDDVIELDVADDGIGFDPDARALRGRHLGLTSMAERAALLDAELDVRSQAGAGTTVSLRVPAARHRPRGGEDT
jgi:signal transduction histidine kinase